MDRLLSAISGIKNIRRRSSSNKTCTRTVPQFLIRVLGKLLTKSQAGCHYHPTWIFFFASFSVYFRIGKVQFIFWGLSFVRGFLQPAVVIPLRQVIVTPGLGCPVFVGWSFRLSLCDFYRLITIWSSNPFYLGYRLLTAFAGTPAATLFGATYQQHIWKSYTCMTIIILRVPIKPNLCTIKILKHGNTISPQISYSCHGIGLYNWFSCKGCPIWHYLGHFHSRG